MWSCSEIGKISISSINIIYIYISLHSFIIPLLHLSIIIRIIIIISIINVNKVHLLIQSGMTIWYHYKGSLLRHRLSERELGTAVICTQFGVISLGALISSKNIFLRKLTRPVTGSANFSATIDCPLNEFDLMEKVYH